MDIAGPSSIQQNDLLPGDSSRAQTSSPIVGGHVFTPWKGHVNSPSQKGHGLNHQVYNVRQSPNVLKSFFVEQLGAVDSFYG